MSLTVHPDKKARFASAMVAALVHLLLALALLRGLGAALPLPPVERVRLVDLAEPPPPPPPRSTPPPDRRARPKDPEGAAAPASLRATPTEIVMPPPPIPIPIPPPVAAAPVAGSGAAPSAGAAPVPGPGTGAGGEGNGLGSGRSGSGTGGGGGGGAPALWLRGGIDDQDYPRRAYEARATGIVYLAFTVGRDGRVQDCLVTRSSGSRELDETTCRLIRKRFRYRPARDASGKAIASVVRGQQAWEIGPEPPVREVEPERVEDFSPP
jgi:protein TonB